ncbi:MAG: hypothetical protein HKN09_10230 [Saprospiraceae bacterium]|nr:hypothetical protein [Saprospiraceae bacterium]
MRKPLIWIFMLLVFATTIHAQTLTDAVRYSQLTPGSTARAIGAGGSFGAMGGDFGVLSINPAGLADYKSSELVFSFSVNSGETNSFLRNAGSLTTQHNNELNFENLGFVFQSGTRNSDLKSSAFSIGLLQYANYTENFGFAGATQGTIIERFIELADGRSPDELDDFEAGLAYESGAIYDDKEDRLYEADIDSFRTVFKKQDVTRSGKMNELVFAWAGRFSNDLAIGIGIGVPFISFEEDKTYQEIDIDNEIPIFNDLSYIERLNTSGTGINFKLGLNYMIENTVRLGLAYQSPTFFRMSDSYFTAMNYDCEVCNLNGEFVESPDGYFEYRLKTPMRLTGSIGTLIKGSKVKGFLNMDVHYLNYTANTFNLTAYSNNPLELDYEREVNGEIDRQLQSAFNFNIGGELAFDRFRVRSGISFVGSPYYVDGSAEYDRIYSIGGGIRGDRVFLDLAYQYRNATEGYIPYRILVTDRQQLVNNESTVSRFIVTLGYKI